ncbi:MAG: hypothetical protein KatS3mg110_3224 [Pirellulaceae bacterium]|nr:MAG: hypothetical protein KatS3mg110_3224 [Pirellulaceae bacterium]
MTGLAPACMLQNHAFISGTTPTIAGLAMSEDSGFNEWDDVFRAAANLVLSVATCCHTSRICHAYCQQRRQILVHFSLCRIVYDPFC